MRGILLACATFVIASAPLRSQAPFGGCQQGSEQGYVRVKSTSELREWDSGVGILDALPGDELRLCRYEGENAVVTIWAEGYGYRVVRKNVEPLASPTIRSVTEEERACIYDDILRVQSSSAAREQGPAFLMVARRRRITLAAIRGLRSDLGRALEGGERVANLTRCADSPAPRAAQRDTSRRDGDPGLRRMRSAGLDAADSAIVYALATLSQPSAILGMRAGFYLGRANGFLIASVPDSSADPGGWRIWRLTQDYSAKVFPELERVASGEVRPAQTVTMPLVVWLQFFRMVISEERARTP